MAEHTIDAVGFDLGETLLHYGDIPLDWHDLYAQALESVAQAAGISASPPMIAAAEERLARYNTRRHPREHEVSADTVIGGILHCWEVDDADAVQVATDAFFHHFQRHSTLYDDTVPALERIHGLGIPMGVLTDVPYGMPGRFVQADVASIARYLSCVVTSSDVGYRKPHTAGFGVLAAKLGAPPGRIAYVGNEPKDIAGALAAGMRAVLIDRDGKAVQYGRHETIRALTDLPALLGLGRSYGLGGEVDQVRANAS